MAQGAAQMKLPLQQWNYLKAHLLGSHWLIGILLLIGLLLPGASVLALATWFSRRIRARRQSPRPMNNQRIKL
jgi:hypothetical protein